MLKNFGDDLRRSAHSNWARANYIVKCNREDSNVNVFLKAIDQKHTMMFQILEFHRLFIT